MLWRELGNQNDAAALYEIYDLYKSYFRSDVNKPQLVKRTEADQALRKAADFRRSLLDPDPCRAARPRRCGEARHAQAIYWVERAITNPSKDVTPAEMQVLLGHLLVKSDDPAQQMRGINLLEALAQRGRPDAKGYLAGCALARSTKMRYAVLQAPRSPPLDDMLAKGEAGPADPKRAFALLSGRLASDVPGVKGALGQAYIEDKIVPRNTGGRAPPFAHLRCLGL